MALVNKMYECFAKGDMATLKTDVFAKDITWNLPGHHPLSGIKKGPDEVIAFFGALMQTGIAVDNITSARWAKTASWSATPVTASSPTARRSSSRPAATTESRTVASPRSRSTRVTSTAWTATSGRCTT